MERKWWQDKIVYQIYPKSFQDTNGDGIGDLRGILDRLDYLKELGVDLIWLSPVYQSPFVDQGYDISDYYRIAEEFGTMEDFDLLVEEAKKRGMGIVMDLVVNHCSDRHEWFQKALADPEGEYGDYFYFRKGRDGRAPSNYRSYFGGSAWEPVPGTDYYYFHAFAKEQPDLNWENPVVREKIYEMVNWWLDKGIAGFRIDAIINIKKDLNFPSFPPDGPDGLCQVTKMVEQARGIGAFLGELRDRTFAPHHAFTVGEVFNVGEDKLEEFVGENGYFCTMFDFAPHILTQGEHGWYDAPALEFDKWRDTIYQSQTAHQGKVFLSNIIENHDEPRGASRYLPEHARNEAGVKMLGTVSVLLAGIPFIYQGQEIGMTNCRMERLEEYDDLDTRNQYHLALEKGCTPAEAMEACYRNSRDNARTPMQWDGSRNAGFTDGTPWLKVNENYRAINVAAQEQDPDSVLAYYRKLIALRKSEAWKATFVYGDFAPAYEEEKDLFAFKRSGGGKRALILANFGKEAVELNLEEKVEQVLLANLGTPHREGTRLLLRPCETVVFQVS